MTLGKATNSICHTDPKCDHELSGEKVGKSFQVEEHLTTSRHCKKVESRGPGVKGAREVMWNIKVRDIKVKDVIAMEKESIELELHAHYHFLWL